MQTWKKYTFISPKKKMGALMKAAVAQTKNSLGEKKKKKKRSRTERWGKDTMRVYIGMKLSFNCVDASVLKIRGSYVLYLEWSTFPYFLTFFCSSFIAVSMITSEWGFEEKPSLKSSSYFSGSRKRKVNSSTRLARSLKSALSCSFFSARSWSTSVTWK